MLACHAVLGSRHAKRPCAVSCVWSSRGLPVAGSIVWLGLRLLACTVVLACPPSLTINYSTSGASVPACGTGGGRRCFKCGSGAQEVGFPGQESHPLKPGRKATSRQALRRIGSFQSAQSRSHHLARSKHLSAVAEALRQPSPRVVAPCARWGATSRAFAIAFARTRRPPVARRWPAMNTPRLTHREPSRPDLPCLGNRRSSRKGKSWTAEPYPGRHCRRSLTAQARAPVAIVAASSSANSCVFRCACACACRQGRGPHAHLAGSLVKQGRCAG